MRLYDNLRKYIRESSQVFSSKAVVANVKDCYQQFLLLIKRTVDDFPTYRHATFSTSRTFAPSFY